MAMGDRFKNGWSLFRTSFRVLAQHPKLSLFPAITSVWMLGILGFFLIPVALQHTGFAYAEGGHWRAVLDSIFVHAEGSEPTLTPRAWGYLTLLYFVSMFAATFANVAFYHEILRALAGEAVSIRRGIRFAFSKLSAIFLWSLFAGVIGYVIRTLEQRVGWIGRIILALIGTAWSVASVFAIPTIIVQEGVNPLEVLRTSAQTLRRTWGESLVGFLGLQFGGLVVLIASLGYFFLVGMGIWMLPDSWATLKAFGITGVILLWLVSMFLFSYLLGVANHIYRCALFTFASQGTIPAPYDAVAMEFAWKKKS